MDRSIVGAVITNGSSATASAGGTCKSSARKTMMPHPMHIAAHSGVTPRNFQKMKPPNAVRKHATGSISGRFAHGHTSGCTNISNPITTSGGNRMKRHPVSFTTITATATNAISAASFSHRARTGAATRCVISSATSSALSTFAGWSATNFFHPVESAASSTVPNMMPGGYHQLVTPKTSGNNPAEIAGATGERSPSTTAIAQITLSSTDANPYGIVLVITIPIAPVMTGVIASMSGELAHVPCGRVNTSCESAPSSGNST